MTCPFGIKKVFIMDEKGHLILRHTNALASLTETWSQQLEANFGLTCRNDIPKIGKCLNCPCTCAMDMRMFQSKSENYLIATKHRTQNRSTQQSYGVQFRMPSVFDGILALLSSPPKIDSGKSTPERY